MDTLNELIGPPTDHIRFIRLPAVKQLTALGKTAIYKRIGEGTFPTPIHLGGSAVAWIEAEVFQWCHDRVAECRPTPAAISVVRKAVRQDGWPSLASSAAAA